MASFLMASTTDKAMNMVYLEAYLIVSQLMKKYRTLDTFSKIYMVQRFTRIKMKIGKDPSILFECLTSIQNQYLGPGKSLDKEELITIVLDVATEEYRAILTIKARDQGLFAKLK
jgi:hypothetical protein